VFATITWRCHMRVSDRRAAERVVGRIAVRLDVPVEMERYERYWKFPELAEVALTSPLGCATEEAALLAGLRCAWAVATPWALGPPGADGVFEGVASARAGARFTVPGVEWMEFHIAPR
jgi:hypothetical protein